MKKSIIISCLVLVLAVCMLCVIACDTVLNTVSAETAKQIAIQNVGAEAADVLFSTPRIDIEKGVTFYEVEFTVNGIKYEYKIDSRDGSITKIEINDQSVDKEATPVAPFNPNAEYIGEEAAKQAALTAAGLSETDVVFSEVELDFDDGIYLYEIEFVANNVKYEYDIKASDGTVYKMEMDNVTVKEPQPSDPNEEYIGVEAAKLVAFTDAGIIETDATLLKAKLTRDNGIHVYEIEFNVGAVEYEYEINATTGTIIGKDLDDDNPTVPQEGAYIGVASAKAIAFNHAGIKEEDATFVIAKLDSDRGVYVYEVEFKYGGYEYEYEINATTGAIIEVDKERD